jgi:hypothetical protein
MEGCAVAIEPDKHWFRIWMLALLLIAAGIGGMHFLPGNHLVFAVAEAFLIAGILALAVDPLVKRDLLREASRGIFVHLLGFEHHPQVKDKLKEIIYGTRLLRNRVELVVTVETAPDGFWITVDYERRSSMQPTFRLPMNPQLTGIRRTNRRCCEWPSLHPMVRFTGPKRTSILRNSPPE